MQGLEGFEGQELQKLGEGFDLNTHKIEREGEIFFLLGATAGRIYIVLMIGVNLGLRITIWKGNTETESPENSTGEQK